MSASEAPKLNSAYTAPGRLGDPSMSLGTDPRTHPSLLQALQAHGLDDAQYLAPTIDRNSPLEDIEAYILQNESSIEGLYNKLSYQIADERLDGVTLTRAEVDADGVRLIIFRPDGGLEGQSLDAVLYFHGGGMVILSTESPMHITWAEAIAKTGLICIVVDFRNALAASGYHPFPAGLDDCCRAIKWVAAHKSDLSVQKLVLQGESGGANLAMASALRAKREGWISDIDGVLASVPFISGAWHLPLEWKLEHLPSLVECDFYLSNCITSSLTARMYTPDCEDERNPEAWPYWASEEEMRGLPPHLIVVNELDQLKDEGIEYARKLARSGVRVVARVNLGIMHEGEMFLRQAIPDVFLNSLYEIKSFVDQI